MRNIEFKGIDGQDYKFETQFTRELIGDAENLNDLSAELYFRASEIVELLPHYEDYFATVNSGKEPSAQQRTKLMSFIKLVLDQIIQDFLRAYPSHLIASEYHPVTGITQDGRLSFHRLAGSVNNLLSILAQMFSQQEAEPSEENPAEEPQKSKRRVLTKPE